MAHGNGLRLVTFYSRKLDFVHTVGDTVIEHLAVVERVGAIALV